MNKVGVSLYLSPGQVQTSPSANGPSTVAISQIANDSISNDDYKIKYEELKCVYLELKTKLITLDIECSTYKRASNGDVKEFVENVVQCVKEEGRLTESVKEEKEKVKQLEQQFLIRDKIESKLRKEEKRLRKENMKLRKEAKQLESGEDFLIERLLKKEETEAKLIEEIKQLKEKMELGSNEAKCHASVEEESMDNDPLLEKKFHSSCEASSEGPKPATVSKNNDKKRKRYQHDDWKSITRKGLVEERNIIFEGGERSAKTNAREKINAQRQNDLNGNHRSGNRIVLGERNAKKRARQKIAESVD